MSSNPASQSLIVAPTIQETNNVDLPIMLSTPTAHELFTTIPSTTGHVMCDESLIALGYDIISYIVGPMPSTQFLEFLPGKWGIPLRNKPFKGLANYKP